ncbi:MlaD family protein [Aldersonia kunmingensis]|uniref:MlaD family protein n=1 Tax=Aldersonia kunmingensis TaxID=408066 RepID=UPI000A0149D9|nr:MlaD family protein [Aldersonia kunmingensis]
MKGFLASRGLVSVVGALVVAALAVVAYFVVINPVERTNAYCAIMPDAIGLYPGNHVTMRGMPVGSVTSIEPEGAGVRVDFDMSAKYPLTGDVMATTVAETLVADRNLAVVGDVTSPQEWPGDTCITKTFTPKSITETLAAFSKLSQELSGDDDANNQRIRQSIEAVDVATSGTAPRLNALINRLADVLRSPNAAIGHIGALVDSTGSLANSIAANWGDIKIALVNSGPGIALINQVWDEATKTTDSMIVLFPWFNSITREYGRPILAGLDSSAPSLSMLAAQVGTLEQLISMVPSIANAFEQVSDPQTGRLQVTYASPKVALPVATSAAVCTAINGVAPGQCGHNGLAQVDLVPLVLGLAGAQ